MDFKIGQKIWLMINNKPVEIILSKIIQTNELVLENENEFQEIKAYASYSTNYQHEYLIVPTEVYASKKELMNAVFGLENAQRKARISKSSKK